MTDSHRIPRRQLLAIGLVLAAFAAAFHIAHVQRRAAEVIQKDGTRFFHLALLPRAYAQSHDGLWPPLSGADPSFALPLAVLPRGYTTAARFSASTKEPVDGLLLGALNQVPAYTLQSVDDAASACIYFGYAVTNEAEFQTLQNALRNGASRDGDIAVADGSGTYGSATLFRLDSTLPEKLRESGVQKATAERGQIPALMERPHDGYVWVYFLDGGFERLPYPGRFPACAAVVEGVE